MKCIYFLPRNMILLSNFWSSGLCSNVLSCDCVKWFSIFQLQKFLSLKFFVLFSPTLLRSQWFSTSISFSYFLSTIHSWKKKFHLIFSHELSCFWEKYMDYSFVMPGVGAIHKNKNRLAIHLILKWIDLRIKIRWN